MYRLGNLDTVTSVKNVMATDQEIVKCNICGVSSKARRCEKSLIIPVSTNEYAGALYIQFTDVAKKFPDVCCRDIFLSDEALIINHILAMENVDCLVNSATKFLVFANTSNLVTAKKQFELAVIEDKTKEVKTSLRKHKSK